MRWVWCAVVAIGAVPALAQATGDLLRTNDVIWRSLSEAEKRQLQSNYIVDVVSSRQVGIIIDAQAVDESTPGTNGGAAIGQAYGSAMYIDNAFKGPKADHPATGHVGAALLGALIGSAMDAPAIRQFRFRYTVRSPDGSIAQFDRVEAQPFRQPAGVCVNLPSLATTTASVCDADVGAFRTLKLTAAPVTAPPRPRGSVPENSSALPRGAAMGKTTSIDQVRCRLGVSGVVVVSKSDCETAEGEIVK